MITRRKTNGFNELSGVYDQLGGQAGSWNLIAELDGNNDLVRSYMWGKDLSGTLNGAGLPAATHAAQAGGVGGLLGVNDANQGFYFVAYDGNGNVMALVDADDGTISAEYEYGPFGELIRSTGPMSDNPIRFSTKYHDNETGLVYYGYRYYWPAMGRWINCDPIGERGGVNLYGYVNNKSASVVDGYGLYTFSGSIDMFLEFWFGRGRDGDISNRMQNDVINSSVVQSFKQMVLTDGRDYWKCEEKNAFIRFKYLPEYNPANDVSWYSAKGIDWVLTGNWQLFLKAKCDTKCTKCTSNCKCKCYTRCRVEVTISKLYTFVYVGGNPANIFTTPAAILLPTQSYIINHNIVTPALDIGKISCK